MSQARGRGVAAALSRKAFTNGLSGMKSPAAPQRLSRDANAFAETLAPDSGRRLSSPAARSAYCGGVRLAAKPTERPLAVSGRLAAALKPAWRTDGGKI